RHRLAGRARGDLDARRVVPRPRERSMIIRIDTDAATVHVQDGSGSRAIPFSNPEAFTVVSEAWLRVGWDLKDVYRFTWLGRPVIQLPEDLVRLQEAVFATKPDAIV